MVASFRERALLDACLSSLLPQCEEVGAALVVARAGAAEELSELERSYPQVRFVRASQNTSLPRLRGMGLAAVDRDVVALTEDHCVAGPDWLAQLSRAAGDVVGGAMDNAQRDRAIDWAAFFSEYGFFARGAGREDGHTSLLTGANVAYRRRVLDDVVAMTQGGQVAFYGPVTEVVDHFELITGSRPVSANPAEYVMDTLSGSSVSLNLPRTFEQKLPASCPGTFASPMSLSAIR